MKVLYVYCHPLPESFHAAIRVEALAGLRQAGHEIDLFDLYAEGFDPVLSPDQRRRYHDTSVNRQGLEGTIARLTGTEGLIFQFPTWSFGPPAMLKGFFDRLFMPDVAFDLSDPNRVRPILHNVKKLAAIVTYGRPRWNALAMSDPPKRIIKRYVRSFIAFGAPVGYHALYHMNVASEHKRKRFMASVKQAMTQF